MFIILIWNPSGTEWTWLPFCILFTESGCSNSAPRSIGPVRLNSWQFMFSEFPHSLLLQHGLLRSEAAGHERCTVHWWPSKYKEYIQGCISVLFSYKVGNVFRSLQGRSPFLFCCRAFALRDNFYNLSQLFTSVNNFFKKFLKVFSSAFSAVI